MSVSPKSYVRKPFRVNAVQVTHENLAEVSEWCKGEVQEDIKGASTRPYIKVPVHRPLNQRQTHAFVGDWILESEMGLKVYTQRAFETSFTETDEGVLDIPSTPAIKLTQVEA